jgi:hypothetical protein
MEFFLFAYMFLTTSSLFCLTGLLTGDLFFGSISDLQTDADTDDSLGIFEIKLILFLFSSY